MFISIGYNIYIVSLVFWIIFAYLLGSMPFGKILAHKRGVDIQKKGSGNIGFTNSLRVLGLKPGLIVLLGDVLKGFIPAFLALRFLPFSQALFVSLIAILAHIFPVWLKFKGGKGIATTLGITFALNPTLAAGGMGVFFIVILATKFVSLSSILAVWSVAILTYLVSPSLTLFYLSLAILATITHRENIVRLIKKKEPKILMRN